MKEYKIYLCSSIDEFRNERDSIQEFFYDLDMKAREKGKKIILNRCEIEDPRMRLEGSQTLYDKHIRESDLIIFLFGMQAGEYTLHELDVAAEYNKRIIVFCKESPKISNNESLIMLYKKLNEYHIEPLLLESIEYIELIILEQLFLSK